MIFDLFCLEKLFVVFWSSFTKQYGYYHEDFLYGLAFALLARTKELLEPQRTNPPPMDNKPPQTTLLLVAWRLHGQRVSWRS